MQRQLLLLCLMASSAAHYAMMHPSVFNINDTKGDSFRNNWPMSGYNFSNWWFHGNIDSPPPKGVVFNLPANGQVYTTLVTNMPMTQPTVPDPWYQFGRETTSECLTLTQLHAVLHTDNRNDTRGCALAIAYKSDPKQVTVKDFVVFSVVHDCIKQQNQSFSIPNLPNCPNGQCLCFWLWQAKGRSEQFMTAFTCNVTGAKPDAQAIDYARAQPARKCYNPARCYQGPRYPYYVYQRAGNNMPEIPHQPPYYSILYGWSEGAQHDIFINTNPNTFQQVPVPAEQRCMNATINPNKLGSRVMSNNASTFINESNTGGIISPNCQYRFYVEKGSGVLQVVSTRNSVQMYRITPTASGKSPYQLQLTSLGGIRLNGTNGTYWSIDNLEGYGQGPFRLDVTDDGMLVMTDSMGMHRWESTFKDQREENVVPWDADPTIWKTYVSDDVTGTSNGAGAGKMVLGTSTGISLQCIGLMAAHLFVFPKKAFIAYLAQSGLLDAWSYFLERILEEGAPPGKGTVFKYAANIIESYGDSQMIDPSLILFAEEQPVRASVDEFLMVEAKVREAMELSKRPPSPNGYHSQDSQYDNPMTIDDDYDFPASPTKSEFDDLTNDTRYRSLSKVFYDNYGNPIEPSSLGEDVLFIDEDGNEIESPKKSQWTLSRTKE
ncbi:hypothetical protein PROFUN_10963 [Planoprotostelium fungivorum]|uniref:Bulb-type lectin domain-containing protein n=1 Tax=Planoprotostelium fungivorum TaxID=1890364 RepID=A0A2P6NBX4_9EUKA|nr:hypothetical protein PROFUN_10963 [Planoprotostelium fungivorum]